ncbi:hypothetical protein F5B20DRAFT_591626 [Whalleya microplaca]|nr:hypothetical protein F5B20DRAFT_591626 [Whalleya microplaca]
MAMLNFFHIMMSRSYLRRISITTICFLVLFIAFKRVSEWSLESSYDRIPSLRRPHGQDSYNSSNQLEPIIDQNPTGTYDSSCDTFPDTSNILVVVKTGATESFAKIPTQLVTLLRCHPGFLHFSDMRQKIAGFDIHDSLDAVLATAKDGNPDFNLYRHQQACPVDLQSCNANSDRFFEGWTLDKYKNIHIAEKAWTLRPNYDWYLFIDADTYILWHNLVQWLRRLDSWKKHYIGSVALIDDFRFGHGGSGYLLSGAAMKDFVGNHSGVANKFDLRIKDFCCGDYMMGIALNETIGLEVEQAWPTMNGEKPYTIPFDSRQWCHPVVTMHHMDPEEISSFFRFEERFYQYQTAPGLLRPSIRFKDIYEEFIMPKLVARREDWDNLSEDVYYINPDIEYMQWQMKLAKHGPLRPVESNAHKSFEHCRELCKSVRNCFQFSYHNGICAYHKGFRLGEPRMKARTQDRRWISGWDVGRIKAWIAEQDECGEAMWPKL